ncbi:MAG: 4-hydroxy-tetrahydrodipicolinate reductase [Bacteroidales bacterium]|nr:4-hydroxy-tetrahydrodipicolinate reductase [Bacteroidales bacterium]
MKIALLGYGKMGHEVERLALAKGHEVVVTIDNEQEWDERLEQLKTADVAIEFSQPDQAFANISRCFDLHLPIVVGTTAWYDRLDEVKDRCIKEHQSLFYAPNFSIGMNMVFRINKQLAQFAEKYGYAMSLAETHHIHKLDKPSGTAAKLANDIIAESSRYQCWSINEPYPADTLPIEVTREGEVFGIHSVTARSSADRITLTHEAFSREGLAQGALAAAQFLIGKTGVFTMENLFLSK